MASGLRLFFFFALAGIFSASHLNAQGRCDGVFQTAYHPGPIPEFGEPGFVVLSYFENTDYILETHQKIIENLPPRVKALVLLRQVEPAQPDSLRTNHYKFLAGSWKNSNQIEFLEVPAIPKSEDFPRNTISYHGDWAQDFVPHLVQRADGQKAFLGARYGYAQADQTKSHFEELMTQKLGLGQALHFPHNLVFDWGNFSTDGRGHFFISTAVLKKNRGIELHQIEDWAQSAFGSTAKLIWIDPVPGERTGHVDMYLKFLDEKKVLVAETNQYPWSVALNKIALQLKNHYEVVRVKMAIHEDEDVESRSIPFRSYTNSLIVGRTAFVPVYHSDSFNRKTPLRSFDIQAAQIFEKLGYRVIPIPSAQSIREGGAVHCLSSLIPK